MISSAQSRGARAFLRWSQNDLANRSEVGKRTIAAFELGNYIPNSRTLNDLKRTFEDHGITFLETTDDGRGIRYRGDT